MKWRCRRLRVGLAGLRSSEIRTACGYGPEPMVRPRQSSEGDKYSTVKQCDVVSTEYRACVGEGFYCSKMRSPGWEMGAFGWLPRNPRGVR